MRVVTHPMMDSFTQENLVVYAGEPGAGGTPHYYQICKKLTPDAAGEEVIAEIRLQHGPRKEVGVNGIGNGTLLLVVWDFLKTLQDGDYRTRENAVAITKMEEVMQWQKQRELDRAGRGVLGTWQK
jgi:hypothetical protein